jgi:hypothetical protein
VRSVEEADLGYGDREGRVLSQLSSLTVRYRYGTGLRPYEGFYSLLLSFVLCVKTGIVCLVSTPLVIRVCLLLKLLDDLRITTSAILGLIAWAKAAFDVRHLREAKSLELWEVWQELEASFLPNLDLRRVEEQLD